ncbi:MAG: M20 family metallopeptidase [Chloroflexi bacterium]|nr:M20 family metallopeptidase [Chloroflexota bacterium]
MKLEELQTKIKGYQSSMLEALEQLVNLESPSTDKPALDSYAQKLAARFETLGAETTLIANPTSGALLKATFRTPQIGSDRPGLLLCHYDTVWPLGTIGQQPFRVDGDKAYGPGAYDMKASHVMAEFALRGIIELGLQLPRPIVILFTPDEEIGSLTSRGIIEEHALQSEYVLVLEPPTAVGALKTARKGVGNFTLQVKGRAAHAGSQPELGISAINELAHQILYLQNFADHEQGTTVNVGVVKGGTRSNVIAARAEADIDVRAWTQQEVERIESAMASLQPVSPGVELEVQGGFNRPPMMRSEAIGDLFYEVQQIGAKLGLDLQEGSTGGGSDGNFTAALGVPTLDGLGAMGGGAHAVHEHILVSDLPVRTGLLAAILLEL